jgi:glutamate--cysteine ligase
MAGSEGSPPVTGRDELVRWFEGGNKTADAWRIGTEHEKLVFRLSDLTRPGYDEPDGIKPLLEGLARNFGWQPITEHGKIIALRDDIGGSITLEPGGQFELSGAMLENIHETCEEVHTHLDQVRAVCDRLGLGMVGVGFDPKWRREDIQWMPKGRYRIMQNYMPKVGSLGLDMMLRTCTVQVNLDYSSEADMVKKFRVSLALQPLATALFANSPFKEGKPNGFMSYRSHVWTDTDNDRCGMLDFVFEDGFGFERYTDYILDVPMYFVHRGEDYVELSGRSFRQFMAGELEAEDQGHVIRKGDLPTMEDWSDHVTTAFPEVRLKRYLELRGTDGGPWKRLCALPALWVGLLYDQTALDAAWDLVKDWTAEERNFLRDEVPRLGLATPFRGGTLADVGRETLKISRTGLQNRARFDSSGNNETGFLETLDQIVQSGESPAAAKLRAYHERWGESVDPLFEEYKY